MSTGAIHQRRRDLWRRQARDRCDRRASGRSESVARSRGAPISAGDGDPAARPPPALSPMTAIARDQPEVGGVVDQQRSPRSVVDRVGCGCSGAAVVEDSIAPGSCDVARHRAVEDRTDPTIIPPRAGEHAAWLPRSAAVQRRGGGSVAAVTSCSVSRPRGDRLRTLLACSSIALSAARRLSTSPTAAVPAVVASVASSEHSGNPVEREGHDAPRQR